MISLIVAMSENRVIGCDGKIPWSIPGELKYFKQVTSGHTVIMGRKTFESIGGPLSQRRNIVLSRDKNFKAEGCEFAQSLNEALDLAGEAAHVFVIGGAALYREVLSIVDRLYITIVHSEFQGDTYFPIFAPHDFVEVRRDFRNTAIPHTFLVLERKN